MRHHHLFFVCFHFSDPIKHTHQQQSRRKRSTSCSRDVPTWQFMKKRNLASSDLSNLNFCSLSASSRNDLEKMLQLLIMAIDEKKRNKDLIALKLIRFFYDWLWLFSSCFVSHLLWGAIKWANSQSNMQIAKREQMYQINFYCFLSCLIFCAFTCKREEIRKLSKIQLITMQLWRSRCRLENVCKLIQFEIRWSYKDAEDDFAKRMINQKTQGLWEGEKNHT